MKKQLSLGICLMLSSFIFAQYESQEKTFKNARENYLRVYNDKCALLKELWEGRHGDGGFIGTSDFNNIKQTMIDTQEFGIRIRMMDANLEKIAKLKAALKK